MVVMQARVIDSTHLELAEPLQAAQGDPLVVSISEPNDDMAERDAWLLLSADSLGCAYADSDPEYSLAMVRERNPEYKG